MKLSFSTRGWADCSWEELMETAVDMRFGGIEVYNAHKQEELFDKGGPFHKYSIAATIRSLNDQKISIPCLDSSCDLSSENPEEIENLRRLISLARDLRVDYVCAFAHDDCEETVFANIESLLAMLREKQITLLIKTSGIYADTARLRDVMNHFACDELAVLWDIHHPYRDHGESAAATIKNLGAYVKHVHLRDSDDKDSYNLIGEGTLPVKEMMNALSSVNYDGFISLCTHSR